jgi:hypothetical protein
MAQPQTIPHNGGGEQWQEMATENNEYKRSREIYWL